jgi:hypothetical protein
MWGGFLQMAAEARRFLADPAPPSDWKEQRRFVLQDTKRKYRAFVQSAVGAKGPRKAARVS